jgi:1,4-dihydroxy-2-naphthoate octaprenyltransferase
MARVEHCCPNAGAGAIPALRAAVEAGLAVGLLTGAVLLVNNFRDAEADARVGRRTLAIVAGPQRLIPLTQVGLHIVS